VEKDLNSLQYRTARIEEFARLIRGRIVAPLIVEMQIPDTLWSELSKSVVNFISRAMHFTSRTYDDHTFSENIYQHRLDRLNITPNGAVVPKREYSLEYNVFLRAWCHLGTYLKELAPDELKLFRITPNVRIKYGQDFEDNIQRGLNTAIPHSDAWVEGPWGFNFHIPLFGDTENNFLRFYSLKHPERFSDDFLKEASSYRDMSWVVDHYSPIQGFIPRKGYAYFSDYAAIHDTYRLNGAKLRVSIDSTLMVGNHSVHADRLREYVTEIPDVGTSCFMRCLRSESDPIADKATHFSHYSTGGIDMVAI